MAVVDLYSKRNPRAAAPAPTLRDRAKAAWNVVMGRATALYPGGRPLVWGGNGGAKWPLGLSSSGRSEYINHTEARRNARAAMQDSVQARAVVYRKASTIADGGLRLELSPVISVLGITQEQANEWARDVEARFHLWAANKKAHRAEQMNWYQSQGLYAEFAERDNDQFVRFTYDKDPDLLNPLQFDFIDPDMIRGDAYTSNYGFQGGVDGILRDERGRETGYLVYVKKPDGTYKQEELPKRLPGGRVAMLHGYRPEYAGQGRGYSPLAHAVQEFENITDFSAAAIKKAINQSNVWGFVEPSKEEDAVNPFDGIMTNTGAGPLGPAAQFLGSDPQVTEVNGQTLTPDVAPGLNAFARIPEATIDTPGSLFVGNLTRGSKITFPPNSAPGDTFDRFVDAFATHLAAAENIPLEVVLMKFGQNYSASRATLLLFYRIVMIERDRMASDYLNPTVEMWMAGEIAAGRVTAPGWSDPRMRAAWLNSTWVGSKEPDIDPAKSAKARRDNLEMGVTNVERESRDLNGTSAAANIAANNEAYSGYKPLPWNEPGNPPPGTPQPAAAAGSAAQARAIAAFLTDDIRAIVREELDNG